GLFAIDAEYVGPGLPLWLPKGTAIVEELEKFAKEVEFAAGYVRVKTPHIAREKMYLTSGHLPILYADSMFPPMELHEDLADGKAGADRCDEASKASLSKFKALTDFVAAAKSGAVTAEEVSQLVGVVEESQKKTDEFLSK